MTQIYGYDTNVYETSIGNIKKDESYITTDEITYSMLVQKIEQLQSNWNSLREWLEVNDRYSQGYFKQVLEYMNELEGVDNENN